MPLINTDRFLRSEVLDELVSTTNKCTASSPWMLAYMPLKVALRELIGEPQCD